MTRETSAPNALTRRSFLKTTGAVAGAAGLAGFGAAGMFAADAWLSPAEANAEPEEETVYTLHQFMCTGNCSLKCTIRDGRLCKIEPNDTVEEEYQHCCMKGISEIQHVYSPDRLQQPLKRVGERGENNFVAISWDEAMQTVGEELKKAWDSYGKSSVYITKSNEPRFGMLAPLLGAATGVEPGIDRGIGNGLDPAIGGNGFGSATSETRDWVNAKTLIMAGCNYLETSLMQGNAFLDAKEAGCEIIVVDPHFSTTASKASKWIPINPGTDPALYLAMITYVVEHKLYNVEHMQKNTTFPFLINQEDGTFLRSKGEEGSYMVWDEQKNSAVPYTEANASAAIDGEFKIEGASYTTVFSRLKKNQGQFTAAWASSKTGIPEETIEELAKKYACNGPAVLAFGQGGSDKYSNPDIEGHAGIILVALTGNVGIPGGSVGCPIGGAGYGGALASWPLPADMVEAELPVRADSFRTTKNDVHVLISLGNTLQQYYANMNLTREWLKTMDFVLHVGMMYEDSVAYADIVLPVCSKFEDVVDHGIVRCSFNHVLLQTKCIDPLFESKTDFEVQYLIAKSVGVENCLPNDAQELTQYEIDEADDPIFEGITFDALVKNNGSMPLKGIEEPRIGFADQKFNTATGRMEIYYEDQLAVNQALPSWEENNEVYEGNPLAEKYPLQFTQTRTKYFVHSHFMAATWLQQFYMPHLEMNPADLEERSIEDGSEVEVYNDRGSFKCHVRANPAVRPGSSKIYEAAWSKYMLEGNPQNVTNDCLNERNDYLMTGAPIPFNDTLVEVKKA